MKHSMLWRSLLREIKGSLGRFLAIFAIVALGVGLFSGLKITKEDFLLSTTKYYRDTNFYDYRIVGELGFSDKEVALFAACKDVESAQGAYSCDAYYHQENGSVQVGRFHSLCDGVNEVILVEGRMPQAPDECLADAYQLGTGIVGKKITIGDETEEQKTEDLKYDTYKVVGAIKSPLYIQFERGNTSLGKGTVQAFFYLPKEGFALEYYTEIYVKFQQDFLLYSKDYEDFMEEKEKEWTKLADKAGEMRFEELPELVARAEGKLFKKKAKARQELEEAKVTLNDGLEKLINASSEVKKGKQALLDGMDELEQAKIDLENGKKEIEEKEPLLEKGKKEYEEGKKKIEDSEKLLTEKEQEYEAGKT
ncbi:MAG: hypothetical protein K5678_11305, partial [Acetatifactor sp.]|nr:hypothetical protein [Acetatifactor sp.]